MSQQPIELILLRQAAEYLGIAMFIADADGQLAFYNEPAATIIGRPFDETREMRVEEWLDLFKFMDSDGTEIPGENMPLTTAVREGRPGQAVVWVRGLDGALRQVAVTSIPLKGQGGTVGAMSIFWEVDE